MAVGRSKPVDPRQRYRRVVLKISGEGFTHPGERGIAMDAVRAHRPADLPGRQARRADWPSSWAAATSSAGRSSPPAIRASTRPRPITWACWPR